MYEAKISNVQVSINNIQSVFKAYYRQGVALQCLGRHAEALAAFSNGLAQDPKSSQLLAGIVEAAMKSPLKGKLVPQLDGYIWLMMSFLCICSNMRRSLG